MSRSWFLLLPLTWVTCLGCERPTKPIPRPPGGMMPTPWMAPGIRKPPVRAAADAGLQDSDPVVGVVVAGKARAYSLAALSPNGRHVVNDVVGGVPVTVTYCDLARCLRVHTDEGKHDALDMSQAGRGTDGLMVTYGGRVYSQATGQESSGGDPLPLKGLPHEQTTWKAWREKHPETEVYTGP
jgi:hypothetical protein